MKKRDGSSKKLRIIDEISSHDTSRCDDFAHKLLNDRLTVRRLRKKQKDDDEFMRAVFYSWLSRDDADEESRECSWESLIQCAEDLGLDRISMYVKQLRDNVHRRE